VDLVVLARLIRTTLANGAAPRGSGWTGDLIKALIDDHDSLLVWVPLSKILSTEPSMALPESSSSPVFCAL
jgi:hypothetical protein